MGDTGDAFKAFNEIAAEWRAEKEPHRIQYACKKLSDLGLKFQSDGCEIKIFLPNGTITLWPYTGWFCGQKPYGKIKGRGIKNLINELRKIQ